MTPSLYMDAEIKPNRSLSERGFVTLISLITAVNIVWTIVFVRMGAPLVPVFLGVDVAAVIVAFMASFAAAKRIERVQVSARDIRVTLETPKQTRLVWESPTAFTRVLVDVEDEQTVAVRLGLSGRAVDVAAALSPRERAEFADALQRAISEARAERG
jgi:uncharacterized membrane protein